MAQSERQAASATAMADTMSSQQTVSCTLVKQELMANSDEGICCGTAPSSLEALKDRMTAALWALFCADALAMPVHWYYNRALMQQQYGVVTDFVDPQPFHPDSFMHIESTGGPGKDRHDTDVVGSVILHDKRPFWSVPGMHYHHSLVKGENTLNVQCARVLMQTVVEHGRYDEGDYLENYVDFMVTPGTHNDTYAESYHREFFRNFSKGLSVFECGGMDAHDTPSVGALVSVPIIAFAHFNDIALGKQMAVKHVRLTHKSAELDAVVELYVEVLLNILHGADIAEECDRACAALTGYSLKPLWSTQVPDARVVDHMGTACYVSSSIPAVLYLAGRHSRNLEAALISNTNLGGSNCYRGVILGAILAAGLGTNAVPRRWVKGLKDANGIAADIARFVDTVLLPGQRVDSGVDTGDDASIKSA